MSGEEYLTEDINDYQSKNKINMKMNNEESVKEVKTSSRELVLGVVDFLILNRNCGLSMERVFDIFWRFNGEEYEKYIFKGTVKKVFRKSWNDKDLILLSKNN